jgi:adenylosuccinate lyase
VLLALVEAGLSREDAYAIVQRNAMQAWETGEELRDLIAGDPDASALGPDALDAAFDLSRALAHADVPFRRREAPVA